MKKFFVLALASAFVFGCTKKTEITETIVPYVHVPVKYTIKEDFEMGSKAAYAVADVSIKTGTWNFDDCQLRSTAGDIKNELKSHK